MAINSKQVTIGDLFGSKKYLVDFYQREYKWNDNIKNQTYKPITSLLDDIFYRFRLCYQPTSDISEEFISKFDWYYLNSFMTNSVGGNTYIVDGQQRLTTLTILTIALLSIGKKLGISDGILKNLEQKICAYDETGEMSFWMGFPDRINALKNIYKLDHSFKVTITEKISITEKNIYEAYDTIYVYLEKHLVTPHIYNAFRLYLYQRIYLISIDVDDSKDVAMAFEVINDRGVPLKAYEILKGKLLGVIDKDDVQQYVQKWEYAINQIANHWGDDEVDKFLSTYFQSRYANSSQQYRELRKDHYHKSIYFEEINRKIGFKSEQNNDIACIEKIKSFVNTELSFYSKLYLKLLTDSNNNNNPSYAWFNSINDQNFQFYLLMSAIQFNDEFDNNKYELVLKQFDKLFTLSNLTGAYQSNYFSADLIDLGIKLRGKNCEEIIKLFSETLINIISKRYERNDITDPFRYELFSNVGYTNLGRRFLRYFFARVDHFIAENAGLNTGSYYSLISQAKGKDAYHIEHILAYDENNENASMFADDDQFNYQRNRLGGLVLLKGRDNQSSGNELYDQKLNTYVGNGTLFAQTLCPQFSQSNIGFNEFCHKYNLVFNTYSQYDANAIEERHKLLFEIVKIIWA